MKLKIHPNPYIRLYMTIFDVDTEDEAKGLMPSDYVETINSVIFKRSRSQEFSHRDCDIIEMIFFKRMTQRSCGIAFGVTNMRIAQLIEKSVKKMSNSMYITKGKYAYENEILSDPFSDHALPRRISNALYRADICDVEKCKNCSSSDLLSLRNFGVGCLKELIDIFAKYGIDAKFMHE